MGKRDNHCIDCGKLIGERHQRCMVCWKKHKKTHIIKRVCQFCGKKFFANMYIVKRGYGKFCSHKCSDLSKRVKKVCLECGKVFVVGKNLSKRKFCSPNCYNIYRGAYINIKKTCKECGKIFKVRKCEFKRKFCSHKCAYAYNGQLQQGKHNSKWKEKKPIICPICGKQFISPYSKKRGQKFCSVRCRNLWNNERMPRKDTSIERKIEGLLKELKLSFKKQKIIADCRTIVDFYIPEQRVVIYCDGDYWHSRPESRKRDITQDFLLMINRYNLLRLKESEINNNLSQCRKKIKKITSVK